ncbi:MAG: lipase family protein [Micrococcales bacterium]|nr:lipase family protein [Micrococcales bacterium]
MPQPSRRTWWYAASAALVTALTGLTWGCAARDDAPTGSSASSTASSTPRSTAGSAPGAAAASGAATASTADPGVSGKVGPATGPTGNATGPSPAASASTPGASPSGDPGDATAPTDDSFYTPPAKLLAGPHGSVIWSRRTAGPKSGTTWLVLYRSVDLHGRPIAVSGTVSLPNGAAPQGGWPVLSWAHGTTGIADQCAPTRLAGGLLGAYQGTVLASLDRWLDAGYAVAATDYQGLGTPGPHPYLIGPAAARSVTDAALAAREFSPSVSTQWFAAGHSQGGHAAMWTAGVGPAWAPSMRLRGVVAFAPPSGLGGAVATLRGQPLSGGGFIPLLLRGAQTVESLPDAKLLTPTMAKAMPEADASCIDRLMSPTGWGGLKTNEVFVPDADLARFAAVLGANDPVKAKPSVPVYVAQGGRDTVVMSELTGELVAALKASGAKVTYQTYPAADHLTVLPLAEADAATWMNTTWASAAKSTPAKATPPTATSR